MSNLLCQFARSTSTRFIRNLQPIRHKVGQGAYEGEGKTTMTILNKDADYGMMIDSISPIGFRLNLGISILGPMLIFPRSVIGWNIGEAGDIDEKSLTIFKVLEPKPDIVILGLDQVYPRDAPFLKDFERIMKSYNIKYEINQIRHACTTFNFLNAESRYCVGAFMPPVDLFSFDQMKIDEAAVHRALHGPYRPHSEEFTIDHK
ncbi:hypothetical protein HCN44_004154 [Aphidius gifuensis]|uniref:NADH dehydrogenase [ubiquinone] 1 alpha subcomplex assembly factor 3 n=1 Tax=Aphidius gifuensis TaxID=684658 RepID=A0A835CSU6_APHGI|nr:NADH dehydrogenase [ubiquinone] 1 alpha subcomplex assembly factor 3 [Aphidius gifuensis]KAF7994682.1 hypothetical protein HCN44_004154 [Aphidius gifuensis]